MARAYPYFLSHEKLPDIFRKIRSAGVPKKFTFRFFASLGFSSSNDRGFIPILKKMGFIDGKSIPTDLYLRLRDANDYKSVLQEQIKLTYKDLYVSDTEIDKKPVLFVKNVFSSITMESDKVSLVFAQTFKALCMVAGFSDVVSVTTPSPATPSVSSTRPSKSRINYNININLPDSENPEIFEAIFKSLKEILPQQ